MTQDVPSAIRKRGMDRFLDKSRSRSRYGTTAAAATRSTAAQQAAKMAPTETSQDSMATESHTTQNTPAPRQLDKEEYTHIADEVAITLEPMIKETVEAAMKSGLVQIRANMQAHTNRLNEVEQRIAQNEEDIQTTQTHNAKSDSITQTILDKMDDLENRSQRNNLRIVGLPETYKAQDLMQLCALKIPKALGLKKQCDVERAHRLGNPQAERRGPRQVIVKHLNYMDKTILQKFRTKRQLIIDNTDLLIFADYSAELTKRRKFFSRACTILTWPRKTF